MCILLSTDIYDLYTGGIKSFNLNTSKPLPQLLRMYQNVAHRQCESKSFTTFLFHRSFPFKSLLLLSPVQPPLWAQPVTDSSEGKTAGRNSTCSYYATFFLPSSWESQLCLRWCERDLCQTAFCCCWAWFQVRLGAEKGALMSLLMLYFFPSILSSSRVSISPRCADYHS